MTRLAMTLLVLGIVGGCSASPDTIDTSGRHPSFEATDPVAPEAKDAEKESGQLLIFSPRVPEENPLDSDATPMIQHSGYTVYTEDGRKVAHEDNHGVRREGPVERKLAPGRYFVRLDEPVPGRTFWVTVEKDRVTPVENSSWHESAATVK